MEHIKSHRSNECTTCSFIPKTNSVIDNHTRNPHKEESNDMNKEHREFKCPQCELDFTSQTSLSVHLSTHNKNNCGTCGTNFWTAQHLEEHLEKQHGAELILCAEDKVDRQTKIDTHIEKMHDGKNCYQCEKCDIVFVDKVELDKHTRNEHILKSMSKSRQYNCKDCAFQGVNRIDLRKHTKSTKHQPIENKEECYTCKQEFNSYWNLMNHRKAEHPSNKICRYFRTDECVFNEETCWYKHSKKANEVITEIHDCQMCGKAFNDKGSARNHMKKEHENKVPLCNKYVNDECIRNDSSCWFIHRKKVIDDKNVVDMEVSEEEKQNDLVFCEDMQEKPPDRIEKFMKMVLNLSEQVQNLQKMAKTSQ